ncbi:hypothetical protein LTR99_010201 [Exophiala xenobiotica]|uniref:Integral membrane protein n=1 Tax=Vermiconidia calcicola TaxID=1690605 RepID=A0AAV9PYF3_9PEZI|nr:hypothetical protein LTR72_002673 [Exophiala xenobiotica]KAK5529393.1 hypothetical protein LTR25_009639 [Vermiconidia calcicola]KAK5529931.1 hypothetical protein LTR23_010531 [Chaetothyriales sp. CCFEE 6169]KAK5264476.1 hypothetical protein LTR96_010238 [Exophiala xenobiotica]KAK5293274.1 hypothetical protein LTR99_010201 [Exophiala xenobiotica]
MHSRHTVVAALLQITWLVAGHEDDEAHKAEMAGVDMGKSVGMKNTTHDGLYSMASYATLSKHSTMILAHAVLMVIAWGFLLPIGVMFSIARSRLTPAVHSIFFVLNTLGVLFGTLYNINTPDLYENNAHHTTGWMATCIMSVQLLISLLSINPGRKKKTRLLVVEREPFLPLSMANIPQQPLSSYTDHRKRSDTEPENERLLLHSTHDASSTASRRSSEDFEKPASEDSVDNEPGTSLSHCPTFLCNRRMVGYLSTRLPSRLTTLLLKTLAVLRQIIDRTILPLGFVCLVTGGITYAGIFRGNHIFNGLAHFIKEGIFFWYGLLTLGRWMGCFAEYGWAWNARPSSTVPSAEFVESFVIFLYGSTNVFLEHLAAWGAAWSAQDLEHVSISVMFFGGGLCGMLIESKTIRKWLNTTVGSILTDGKQELELRTPPKVYNSSVNPIPALIIFLLGIMMSSHHQSSMISTAVHKQWGMLLAGFSVMRMLTYTMIYISPPTSGYPSRPPTELVSSFCLMSGGIVFMASTKDIVLWMEAEKLMAMFLFTVTSGFTAFIMAYEILVLSLKGWATRHEIERPSKSRLSGS